MLKLHSIFSPADSRAVFSNVGFHPSESTWVVSDLKSKIDLNRRLLSTRDFVESESVMRASELWKALLDRVRPDLQVVSREFVITLIAQKLSHTELDWARAPGAAQAAFDYLTQLMPVLAHPNGEEMMRDWLKANSSAETRWGRWFDLSLTLWKEFLTEGFVAAPWVIGVLTNEPEVIEVWTRPLIVDLGADLNQVEADLLVMFSERIEITVLRPEPEWSKEYKKALIAYEVFDRKLKVEKTTAIQTVGKAAIGKTQYRKYTTMIAEVKDAVAFARTCLDGKTESLQSLSPFTSPAPSLPPSLSPSQIAIVAPDIEVYWPALESYLEQEGIPCQKNHVRRLHTYPDIARWLAALRLRTGAFNESDLELALFNDGKSKGEVISYDRFKTIYSTLYGREDFSRSAEVEKKFAVEITPGQEISRDDFVTWSLKQLPAIANVDRVEALFIKLFSECPQGLTLSMMRWLAFIEQLAARIEVRVRDGDPNGVACIGLGSAVNSPVKQMIVLGLTEAALKPSVGTAILFSDINDLARQFGFHLASEERVCLEFEARWVIEDPEREVVLSVPETDFSGSAQAPSWLWVRGSRATHGGGEVLTVPSRTRWDEIQSANFQWIAQNRNWIGDHANLLEISLNQDLGLRELDTFSGNVIHSLSPSAIEDYLDCPFVFAAKRLFALSDVSELDLEVDAGRRGSLMHKLFELLTVEPMRFDFSDQELGQIVEQAREACHLELADERLWISLRARHLDLGRRFLEFEKLNRRQFPETKTVAREGAINGYIDPASGELTCTEKTGALKFVGRIDRIDGDSLGNVVVYDYKSSAASTSQFGSWVKNNQIQLLLYASAVKNGLYEHQPHPVVGALYFTARPLDRDTGFKVEDSQQHLFDTSNKRKRNRLTRESLEHLEAEGRELVRQAVVGIASGQFAPHPRSQTQCIDCNWSTLCRAPHLTK